MKSKEWMQLYVRQDTHTALKRWCVTHQISMRDFADWLAVRFLANQEQQNTLLEEYRAIEKAAQASGQKQAE